MENFFTPQFPTVNQGGEKIKREPSNADKAIALTVAGLLTTEVVVKYLQGGFSRNPAPTLAPSPPTAQAAPPVANFAIEAHVRQTRNIGAPHPETPIVLRAEGPPPGPIDQREYTLRYRDPISGRYQPVPPGQALGNPVRVVPPPPPSGTPVPAPPIAEIVPGVDPNLINKLRKAFNFGISSFAGIGALGVDQVTAPVGATFAVASGYIATGVAGATSGGVVFGGIVIGRAIFGDRDARGILHDVSFGLVGEPNEEIVYLKPRQMTGQPNDP